MKLHDDSTLNPAEYICVFGDVGIDNDALDRTFRLEDGLFMSMLSCDLVQTKNLNAARTAIAQKLHIQLDDGNVRVDNKQLIVCLFLLNISPFFHVFACASLHVLANDLTFSRMLHEGVPVSTCHLSSSVSDGGLARSTAVLVSM